MKDQVSITIDREVYDQLQLLMVPPFNDANSVIKGLLFHEGRASRGAVALEAEERHFTYEQELERAIQGVYEFGGGT
ncbi:MAG: hypothetical protein HXY27_06780 [Hydrogenophilaceae bacterium]|nr:hypothetical protein [Hydrogenophilaceae bacterium]